MGGIGFEVAKAFALSRAKVYLLSRKVEHGDEAIAKIKEAVNEYGDVKFVECDLGNLKPVREVADKIRNDEDRLDIVCAHTFSTIYHFITYDRSSLMPELALTNSMFPAMALIVTSL